MAEAKQVEITEEQIQDANAMWKNFTVAMKYSTIVTIVILIGLALAFVKFF